MSSRASSGSTSGVRTQQNRLAVVVRRREEDGGIRGDQRTTRLLRTPPTPRVPLDRPGSRRTSSVWCARTVPGRSWPVRTHQVIHRRCRRCRPARSSAHGSGRDRGRTQVSAPVWLSAPHRWRTATAAAQRVSPSCRHLPSQFQRAVHRIIIQRPDVGKAGIREALGEGGSSDRLVHEQAAAQHERRRICSRPATVCAELGRLRRSSWPRRSARAGGPAMLAPARAKNKSGMSRPSSVFRGWRRSGPATAPGAAGRSLRSVAARARPVLRRDRIARGRAGRPPAPTQ